MISSHERVLYRVNRFIRDFRVLPKANQLELWRVANILVRNVFDSRLNVKKLVGYRNIWRVRIGRDWRMIFTFDEISITLLRVAHRKDIYKLPFSD